MKISFFLLKNSHLQPSPPVYYIYEEGNSKQPYQIVRTDTGKAPCLNI